MPDKRKNRGKRRTERKHQMCDRKVSYPCQYLAMRAACRTGLRWYRCDYCHTFHLTKAVKAKGRNRQW